MKNILNCYNYETTMQSLKKILGIDEVSLYSLISKNNYHQNLEKELSNLIDGLPIKVHFFHFTKSLNPGNFGEGLFPLNIIKLKLTDEVYSVLKEGGLLVEREQWEIFVNGLSSVYDTLSSLTSFTRLELDDGPNGFLIREFGLTEQKGHVYYLRNPEFISDLLNAASRHFDYDCYYLYEKKTKKCIIEFSVIINDKDEIVKYLKQAVEYIQAKLTNDIDGCSSAFHNKGVPIPKDSIVNVEVLSEA